MINPMYDDYLLEDKYICIIKDFHFIQGEQYTFRLYNNGGLFDTQCYRIFDRHGVWKYSFDVNSAYDRNIFPHYFINIKKQRKEKLLKLKNV